MIEQLVSDIFRRIGHMWTLDTGFIQPTEEDVRQVLDEAAKHLYDGAEGDQLETGGLIIERLNEKNQMKSVYVWVGDYE